MKILVTGADGMLGSDLVKALLAAGHDVVATDLPGLDITDPGAVRARLGEERPDRVVHCAAMTDVDGCESRRDDALRVNWLGTRHVAQACRQHDLAMLYISTDYVFSGCKGAPYAEWEAADPRSVYGQSKWAGEVAVRECVNRHFVVRTSGLYGRHGKNFVATILRAARERPELHVVHDQVTLTTYTGDLAQAITALVGTDAYGTYHLTNRALHEGQGMSWFEWTQLILHAAGLDGVKVTPITAASLARPAPRPAHSVLEDNAFRLRGFAPLRPCTEALQAYLHEMCEPASR